MDPEPPSALVALIEDEEHLAQGLLFNLEAEGYRTHHESDGDAALAYLLAAPQSGPESISVIVLDCMLPGTDGFAIVRIKSLLRRTAWQAAQAQAPAEPPAESAPPDTYAFNHRTIRFDALELIAPNRITQLTVMEADLLRYLTDREGQIIPRSDILERVWHVHADTDTRAIDNFIVRLRRYIEDDPANPQHLTTVRGIGYRFLANPDHAE